ncbi:hypothetical protein DESC_940072 [Desulfosarcina cetonica]|nr:hypothetical protein DESC_940072 [Desulfosarcina cetonica]
MASKLINKIIKQLNIKTAVLLIILTFVTFIFIISRLPVNGIQEHPPFAIVNVSSKRFRSSLFFHLPSFTISPIRAK